MNKITVVLAAAAVSFWSAGAQAGGWGMGGNTNNSGAGLINVAPAVSLSDLNVLNGVSILDRSPILSGNNTVVGNGILNGVGLGILGIGSGVGSAPVGMLGGNSYTENSGNSVLKNVGNSYSLKKHR